MILAYDGMRVRPDVFRTFRIGSDLEVFHRKIPSIVTYNLDFHSRQNRTMPACALHRRISGKQHLGRGIGAVS